MTVHPSRDPDGQALHPRGERQLVARLDEHVQVVLLNRELNDSELTTRGRGDAFSDDSEHVLAPQRRKSGPRTHGEVNRMT
jgi:hypothetical protein